MDTLIETFRPEHGPAWETLNRAWLSEHGLLEPANEPQLTDPVGEILAPGGQIFVAVRGAEVVGTCAVIPHGPDELELAKLAVAQSVQGHGIGRRLVEACLAFAREEKIKRVVLLSNARLAPALRLYEHIGFQHRPLPTQVPYEVADVYMELELDPATPAPSASRGSRLRGSSRKPSPDPRQELDPSSRRPRHRG